MAAWGESTGEALHTSTFLGHPVAAAAALETLAVLREEDVPGRAQALGADLRARLAARLAGQPFVAEVRGRGLMMGVEFRDPATGAPAPRRAWSTVVHALQSGLLLLPAGIHGEVVQVTPPVVLTPAQVDALVEGLGRAVEQAEG
jgi:4-aminobutyrate aminotransferase-like enzyme